MRDVLWLAQAGFVVDHQIAAGAVDERVFLVAEDNACIDRAAPAARYQIDQPLPAGNECAGSAVGDQVAGAIYARLEACWLAVMSDAAMVIGSHF